MRIAAVIVESPVGPGARGGLYQCQAVPDRRGVAVWKCGKCQHGVIKPVVGDRCRVCGCKVVRLGGSPT